MHTSASASSQVQDLLRTLTGELARKGCFRSPGWRDVFARVPRHHFLQTFYGWKDGEDPHLAKLADDPDRWLKYLYSDRVVVLNAEDGRRSSSSQPSMMMAFLNALDLRDGNSVLEIGTGSGYNAALLCERLGSEHVTTIDVDPEHVQNAGRRLFECGYTPTLAVADGLQGYPPGAPYDRIVATASVERIPEAWIDQLKEGGVLVAPLRGGRFSYGLAALRKTRDGAVEGRLCREGASFMEMRGQHLATSPAREQLKSLLQDQPGASTRTCTVPWWFDSPILPSLGILFFVRVELPDLMWFWRPHGTASWTDEWLPGETIGVVGWGDRSWAIVERRADGRGEATEGGPRRLLRLVEEATSRWSQAGEPTHVRYGITAYSEGGQCLWLDCPCCGLTWNL